MITEACRDCGSTEFMIVRDTTSRRICSKCGNAWNFPVPPKAVDSFKELRLIRKNAFVQYYIDSGKRCCHECGIKAENNQAWIAEAYENGYNSGHSDSLSKLTEVKDGRE